MISVKAGWWSQTGSNRRPHACKARALPAELWPHDLMLKAVPQVRLFIHHHHHKVKSFFEDKCMKITFLKIEAASEEDAAHFSFFAKPTILCEFMLMDCRLGHQSLPDTESFHQIHSSHLQDAGHHQERQHPYLQAQE